jgi:hypothetical protein
MNSNGRFSLQRIGRTGCLVGVLLASLLSFVRAVRADIGPKPTMDFEFHYESGTPLAIVEGSQLECDDASCSDGEPLLEGGPQRFTCSQDDCHSLAYGYAPYHRLVIRFSDGLTRESNVFTKDHFEALYRVTVRQNDLVVEEIGGSRRPGPSLGQVFGFVGIALVVAAIGLLLFGLTLLIILVRLIVKAGRDQVSFDQSRGLFIVVWSIIGLALLLGGCSALARNWPFSLALLLTMAIEGLVVVLYASLRGRSRLTLLTLVTLVNLISQPLLWILLVVADQLGSPPTYKPIASLMPQAPWAMVVLAEIVVWLLEAVLLYLMQRKTLSFKEALALSAILNAASFGAGLLLPL